MGSMKATQPPSPPRESIRVGIVVPGLNVPLWVAAVAHALAGTGFVELTVVVADGAPPAARAGSRWSGGRLWHAYRAIDLRLQRIVCRRSVDPSAIADLAGLGYAMIDGPPGGVDLLVGALDLSAVRALATRVGAPLWWFDHDGHERWPAAASGYAEVLSGSQVTRCRLMAVASDGGEPAVLRTAFFATHPLFGAENRVQLLWKSIPLLLQKVRELRDCGDVVWETGEEPPGPVQPSVHTERREPLLIELARHGWRSARFVLRRLLWREQWFLLVSRRGGAGARAVGERADQPSLAFRPTRALIPAADRYWADPHFLPRGEDRLILVEEYIHAERRGRIALLRLGESGEVAEVRTVLERECHLSYPAVFELADELYMVPESSELERVEAYRCTSYPWRWEHAATLLTGVRACDSSIVEYGGRWWMFATVLSEPWLTPRDTMHVYYAEDPLNGPWRSHPGNPVVCDVYSARPAGRPFVCDGRLYRPSQDCSRGYGYAIRINEVTTLTESRYEERALDFLEPSWHEAVATHTFALGDSTIVVDAMRWQRRDHGSRRPAGR